MESKADIIAIRHGRTKYTEEGLDLTEQGVEESRQTARDFSEQLKDYDEIIIVSSPLARTLGTAKIFLEELGMNKDVRVMKSIRCVDIYDLQKFNEFSDANSTETYGQMWFNNEYLKNTNQITEGSEKVNKRAYRFLYHMGRFILDKASKEGKKICIIAFTHFEIASNYLKPLYPEAEIFPNKDAPGLNNSEAVMLSIGEKGSIKVKSRGREGILTNDKIIFNEEL